MNKKAAAALEKGLQEKTLACADISFWEITMLMRARRLRNNIPAAQYMNDTVFFSTLFHFLSLFVRGIRSAIDEVQAEKNQCPAGQK